MLNVKLESNYTSVKVYIDDTLHLSYRRKAYLGLQSWVLEGLFYIEIYLIDANPILVEYERKELWQSVLAVLNKVA